MEPERLLNRLDEIGRSLEQSGQALALIGLGSVGLDQRRLDAYSDLDFFVVAVPGAKRRYLEDLDWMRRVRPVVYRFQNTRDGHKLLFDDGVFCEFAVFEPDELRVIPFAPGRIVWKQPAWPAELAQPVKAPDAAIHRDPDWLLGEALTNLLVGVARELRGETLSGHRFIQGNAVDRVVELADHLCTAVPSSQRDVFSPDRRFEQRHPQLIHHAPEWLQGYRRNRESALAILAFLEANFDVNHAIGVAIRELCER